MNKTQSDMAIETLCNPDDARDKKEEKTPLISRSSLPKNSMFIQEHEITNRVSNN